MLIDSCLNPTNAQPASLAYLNDIGVDPADAVVLVIVTHWDDDHVGGIAETVGRCSGAQIVCSAALCREDIVEFIFEQDGAGGAFGSGLDELRTLLKVSVDRGPIVWAKANLPLHPRPPGDHPVVVALSPSEDAVPRSVESLIEASTGSQIGVRRRYRAPEGPNGASVATVVRVDGVTSVLGADLESRTQNQDSGWHAVLEYSKPTRPASLFKVPHHGSEGAHYGDVWTDMLHDDVVAIVTPWTKGQRFLPTNEDLDRLAGLTRRLYVTATPSLSRAEKDPEIERLVRRLHPGRIEELRGWGHVRARCLTAEEVWEIECDGDARALDHDVH